MSGPWGWMGYCVDGDDDELQDLMEQATETASRQDSTLDFEESEAAAGGWGGEDDDGDYEDDSMPNEHADADGQWTNVSLSTMKEALRGFLAGDDEALILH